MAILSVVSASEMIGAGGAENAIVHWTSGGWLVMEIRTEFKTVTPRDGGW